MLLVVTSQTACTTINLDGTKPAEKQVTQKVEPALNKTICRVLGAPIYWSSADTKDTRDQIAILHNSQWVEFNCEKVGT